MYAYWVCAARETPIFSPEFLFCSISFSQICKINPFQSITILHFFGGFCHSGDHHFQNVLNFNPFIASHGRLSPNVKHSAAPRVSQTRPGSSGDSHFHAQNGSSSFRSRAFSRSTRSSFRSPVFSRSTGSSFRSLCPFFTLPRHIPTKIWGESPPPPPCTPGICLCS